MEKLTAIIPTFNEEHNIVEAIQSVDFADEIIVVDSFSTDKTVELATPLVTKVLQREYINSSSQKNWSIPQAQNNWILLIDADERVTPELKLEVVDKLKENPVESGFWIYRINHFMGKKINFSGWRGDKVIRLFKRDECKYETLHVHAEIISDGKIGFLNHKFNICGIEALRRCPCKMAERLRWKLVIIYHLLKPLARF